MQFQLSSLTSQIYLQKNAYNVFTTVCPQDNSESNEWISMKYFYRVHHGSKNNQLDFGGNVVYNLAPVFLKFLRWLLQVLQHT